MKCIYIECSGRGFGPYYYGLCIIKRIIDPMHPHALHRIVIAKV